MSTTRPPRLVAALPLPFRTMESVNHAPATVRSAHSRFVKSVTKGTMLAMVLAAPVVSIVQAVRFLLTVMPAQQATTLRMEVVRQ